MARPRSRHFLPRRVSCLVHQVGCIWHTWDVMSGKFGASLFLHKLEMLAWTAPWHTIYASCFDDLWIFSSKSEIEPSDRYQIKWVMTFDLHHAIWQFRMYCICLPSPGGYGNDDTCWKCSCSLNMLTGAFTFITLHILQYLQRRCWITFLATIK